ncbi:DUF5949 family protein [Streptomyces ziwulingensis]|uniref:DUF5949 family protein n=1 Tax=Streptomyces ziwulingensis TaxID=1045501 RepID=A0ABP9B463_9ACTN
MTSLPSETLPLRTADLGTLVVMSWSREAPEGDIPYLLACSLGDGANGPEAGSAAVERLLRDAGLPVADELTDAARRPSLPVSLLVLPNAAVLTMPGLNAQFVPPAAWLAAVGARGKAYLIFTTRPWPDAEPGDAQTLTAFTSEDETLKSAAHVLLPARKLR